MIHLAIWVSCFSETGLHRTWLRGVTGSCWISLHCSASAVTTFDADPQRFPLADDTLAWSLGEWEATVTVRNAIIIENFGKWHLQTSATEQRQASSIFRSLLLLKNCT